jgi:hypothetical protein
MTFDTTQILILAFVASALLDKAFVWYVVHLLAGSQRAPTFPPPVTPPTPPVRPGPDVPSVKPPVDPGKPPIVPDKPPVVVTPPVPPVPTGPAHVWRGKCSVFGGPHDKGSGDPDEKLAFITAADIPNFQEILLPGAHGDALFRQLNPASDYFACRFDYTETPKAYLKTIHGSIKNTRTGQSAVARPADWGPNVRTGRVADLSPGLAAKLGLNTDDTVEVSVPLPAGGPAQPDQPTTPPVTAGGDTLQKLVWPTQAEVWSGFYDPVKLVHVQCPWVFTVEGTHSQTITIHEKCAASLTRVLNFIWENAGKSQDKIHEFGYDVYDGSYAVRSIRGGSSPSMHSYGVAMDWNAAANPQHAPLSKTKFKPDSLIVKAFKDEGWTWGGDWSPGSIDAMHFQAARVH